MSIAPPQNSAIVDTKLEAVVIPVSDVDRAKLFYGKLGWRLDADFAFDNGFRVVQYTPPGSPCSVQFGTNITTAPPGSAQGLYLIVADIESARNELGDRGAEVSEVFHPATPGAQFQPAGHPLTRAIVRSQRSAIRMATSGCCRKSGRACRDEGSAWTSQRSANFCA